MAMSRASWIPLPLLSLLGQRGVCSTVVAWWTCIVLLMSSVNGYRNGCTVDDFRHHLTRVCAIYSKRSTEFHMRPLLEEQPKPLEELETLWGYYMREWQASPDTGKEPVGMLYQIIHDVDGKTPPIQVEEIPQPQLQQSPSSTHPAISYPHPLHSKPGPNTDSSNPAGIVAIHFRVLTNDSHPNQKLTSFDPFRWRRNAMLKSLVVKCCSKGCIPGDFVAVVEQYSMCPGFVR